jgi:hypothetical protein
MVHSIFCGCFVMRSVGQVLRCFYDVAVESLSSSRACSFKGACACDQKVDKDFGFITTQVAEWIWIKPSTENALKHVECKFYEISRAQTEGACNTWLILDLEHFQFKNEDCSRSDETASELRYEKDWTWANKGRGDLLASPYANSEGMYNSQWSPSFIICMASVQPLMTY